MNRQFYTYLGVTRIKPDSKIYILIGLNESGKTTILEAISDFVTSVPPEKAHLLIPKSQAGGFTGETRIESTLEVSLEDKNKIEKFLHDDGLIFSEIIIDDVIKMHRYYKFENSKFCDTGHKFTSFIKYKTTSRAKNYKKLESALSSKLWSFIYGELFPEVVYYKDFLSTFPEKIYLQPAENNEEEGAYLDIIDDILAACNKNYNVQASLLERMQTPTDANTQALEAVTDEMKRVISKKVFDAWSKIQEVSKREIDVKTGKDTTTDRFYVKLSIKDGGQTFSIAERSLGFRWFFTFLLYTEFRKERLKRAGEILFLLDEPASNLHQSAQQSLLTTFKTITSKSRLIYTTHSHHLISPLWLDSSYIVRNKGLDYKREEDYNLTKTEVEAYKYKQFVSRYPDQTTYYQPILDVLDYKPGLLEKIPKIVITEGKSDYFLFKYFLEVILQLDRPYRFYPGHGAPNLDQPIRLYESWGRDYLVLLDDDSEGIKQKKRYIKEIASPENVFTYVDIDGSMAGFQAENLLTDSEKLLITKEFDANSDVYEKSKFNTGVKTLLANKIQPNYIKKETEKKFEKVFDFIDSKFNLLLE